MLLLDGGTSNSSISALGRTTSNSHIEKISNVFFNYSVRISGEDIIKSEFNYLSCNSDTTLNLMVPKILKSVTIGPEGGKLETEGFSLIIPEGAFSFNNNIILGKGEKNVTFPHYELTDLFLVEGIPNSFNESIRIKIKYQGNLSDSNFIAIGKSEFDAPETNTEIFYDLKMAADSADYLISEYISPYNFYSTNFTNRIEKSKLNGASSLLRILGLGGKKIATLNTLHFEISYPEEISEEKAKKVGTYLEESYDRFVELGFNYFNCAQWSLAKKVKVLIKSSNMKNYGNMVCDYRDEKALIINGMINKDYLIDLPDNIVKRKTAALFFELITFLYDIDRYNTPGRRWIHIASNIWAATMFPENDDYIPAEIFGNELTPLNGIESNAYDISSDQIIKKGAGMSALIKYITKFSDLGNNLISEVYSKLEDKEYPVQAIQSTMKRPISFWLPEFFKEYIRGNIYQISPAIFLKNITKTITFNKEDTLKKINDEISQLSAKRYLINFNTEEIKDRTLNFHITSEGKELDAYNVLVWGISNNILTFLAQGQDFKLRNLKKYQERLVYAVNSSDEPPYSDNSKIQLDIKVTDDLAFKYCDIRLAVIEMHDTVEGVWSPGWYTKGTFKNNIFDGTINTEKQGGNSTGTIRIIVDDNQNILSLNVMAYHTDPTGYSSQWGFTAQNIPPTENEPYLLVHSYQGYDVCKYVTGIYAKYTEADGKVTEIRNFKCEDESLLHIKFQKLNW